MKKLLLLVLACSSLSAMNSAPMSIKKSDIFASQALGRVRVMRDNDGFKVKQNGTIHEVQSCDVDKTLRGMSNDQLARLLKQKNALIKVNKLSNGDFTLGLDGQLKGGGPISGMIAGWAVRTASYAGISCAVWLGTTTAIAAGGGAGAAMGGGYIAAKLGLGTAGKVVAAGLVNKGVATEIGLAVAAMGPEVIAAVETAAVGTQALVTVIPWLP